MSKIFKIIINLMKLVKNIQRTLDQIPFKGTDFGLPYTLHTDYYTFHNVF